MVWPFSRKNKDDVSESPPPAGPQAPRAAGADQALVDEILAWLGTHLPTGAARQIDDGPLIYVGHPPEHRIVAGGPSPAGAVLKVRRGKLSWVDLYDPNLRPPMNDLIKYLDRQQKWSFNGVVSSKYKESGPPGQS